MEMAIARCCSSKDSFQIELMDPTRPANLKCSLARLKEVSGLKCKSYDPPLRPV